MCPICKENNSKVLGSPEIGSKAARIITKDYQIVQCLTCQTYYVEPEINFTKEEWAVLYDEEYFAPMSKWYYKNRENDRKKRFDKLFSYCQKSVFNFLDVGCGEGYSLIEAEKRGWKAYGNDITDNRISQAKKDSIIFNSGTLTDVDYPENFFDVVYVDSVLEHIVNPDDYLFKINKILRKGGMVYIGVPNEDSLLNDFKAIFYLLSGKKFSSKLKPFETPYHVVGFNKSSLKYALLRNNFAIKELRNFACRVEFMKTQFLSKYFFHSLALLPIYMLAVPLRKEVYLEVYAQK